MHPCNPSPTYYLLFTTHNLLLGGHVLLVASSAAAAPGVPGVAAYAASKAYVRRRAGYPPSILLLVPASHRSLPQQLLPIPCCEVSRALLYTSATRRAIHVRSLTYSHTC